MAQRGGKRPGAGRKKGSRAVATVEQGATLADLARAHTADALAALVKVLKEGESEAARVTAANAILDRGFGKPTQSHEHSGPNGGPIEYAKLSDQEIAARIAAHEAARAAGPTTH
jgi:hypothetical protein